MGCCFSCCKNFWSTCYIPICLFEGVCSFPQGVCYSLMGILMAFGGVMMNFYVLGSCLFERIYLVNPTTGETIPGSERGYGFRSHETDYGLTPDYRQCSYYTGDRRDEVFDGWFWSAKIFSYLSGTLGFIAFVIMFTTCCCVYSEVMYERWLLWMYLIAAICISLSFLAFGSDFCQENQCKIAQGAGYAISTFLFWLMSANTVKSMGKPLPPRKNRKRDNNGDGGGDGDNNDDDDDDSDDDDLWYENEEDKYKPRGRRREDDEEEGGRRRRGGDNGDDDDGSDDEFYDDDEDGDYEDDDEEYDDDEDGEYYDDDEDDHARNGNHTPGSKHEQNQHDSPASQTARNSAANDNHHTYNSPSEDPWNETTMHQANRGLDDYGNDTHETYGRNAADRGMPIDPANEDEDQFIGQLPYDPNSATTSQANEVPHHEQPWEHHDYPHQQDYYPDNPQQVQDYKDQQQPRYNDHEEQHQSPYYQQPQYYHENNDPFLESSAPEQSQPSYDYVQPSSGPDMYDDYQTPQTHQPPYPPQHSFNDPYQQLQLQPTVDLLDHDDAYHYDASEQKPAPPRVGDVDGPTIT